MDMKKVAEMLAEYKGVSADGIQSGTTFAELGLDSLDMAELVMKIEDELGITIEMSPEIKTVGDIVALLN